MRSDNSNASRAAAARGLTALFAVLAMGLGLLASAVAAPFAYVTNDNATYSPATVSVIDTATNTVVATVGLGEALDTSGVAVTPDGKHVYVTAIYLNGVSVIAAATNTVVATVALGDGIPYGIAVTPDGQDAYVTTVPVSGGVGTVSVITTATNTVAATVTVGSNPQGVAITPDGKHAYVTNFLSNSVSVIDTATNTVVGLPIPVPNPPDGVAVTPDGKHAYVVNYADPGTVSVIDTATNTVEAATVAVGSYPYAVALAPDGTHAYVTNTRDNTVSVIATARSTVVATVPVGNFPYSVAVTPDGKHAYVVNSEDGTVSAIDTATNTVVATVPVGIGPVAVGIVPPPPGVPFLAFNAVLNIDFGTAPNTDAFTFGSSFTLSSTAPVFNPLTDPVTLQIGTFAVTIPPGSFNETGKGIFSFEGVINGVTMKAVLKSTGTLRYNFQVGAQHASLTGTQNAVYVTLAIGGGSFSNSDSGATSVTAMISGAAPSVKAAMSR